VGACGQHPYNMSIIHLEAATLFIDAAKLEKDKEESSQLFEEGIQHFQKAIKRGKLSKELVENVQQDILQWLPYCKSGFVNSFKSSASNELKDIVCTTFTPTLWSDIMLSDKIKEDIKLVTTLPIKSYVRKSEKVGKKVEQPSGKVELPSEKVELPSEKAELPGQVSGVLLYGYVK
jgi:hypothetical protein